MKKEYSLDITLKCPICADTDFVVDNDQYICNSCKTSYERFQLIEENSEEIELSKHELVNKIKSDVKKDILSIFKNSKVFKVKK